MDRVILYRIPKGGIPEEGINEGDVIAARVPIYGTKDAGRGWWLKLNDVVKGHGLTANRILPTLFSLRNEHQQIVAMMSTNVDDFLYGYKEEGREAMGAILDAFTSTREDTEFRFCGKKSNSMPT